MLYWVVKAILTPILRVGFRPWVEGRENIPKDGPAILAQNHLSYLDWLIVPLVVPRKVSFLAKSDYFTGKGVKGYFQKVFFTGTGQVPVERTGGSSAGAALSTAKKILDDGKLFGIYPEGTRSPDGRLYRGKTGVARLALETGVPVIPVAGIGLFEIAPEGRRLPRLKRVGLRIGAPLEFSRYTGMESDRFVLRSVTDEIMYALMLASGQEYVDHYAAKAKADQRKALRDANEAAADADGAVDPEAHRRAS